MVLFDNSKKSYDDGFTLVEVGIIMPMLIVIVIGLFGVLFAMIHSSAIEKVNIAITYDAQKVLTAFEGDASLTSAFLPTSDTTVADPYKPTTNGNQWSYLGDATTSATRVLMMRVYNTSTNPYSTTRTPSYLSALGCTESTIYLNSVLQYDVIYFVSGSNLYRRTDIDTTQATCLTPYQKQSCPSLDTLGLSSRDAACVVDDELIAKDVTAFSVDYFASDSETVPLDVYSTGADPDLVTTATTVVITTTITRKAYGDNLTGSSTIRVSRLNRGL
jgi:type II secretory pathway pseudopilin PulG